MKIIKISLLLIFLGFSCVSQKNITKPPVSGLENALLWKISGNGLEKPSYLYGTIHMLCEEDAFLSDSLIAAIDRTDRVYLELDMDNVFEMLSAFRQMKMKNDTTLKDLLSPADYQKVKDMIETKSSLLPFSELETFKPLLTASFVMESGLGCDNPVAMEMLVMEETRKKRKKIEGLETMSYQLSIFDSIPYKVQADQLVKYAAGEGDESKADEEFNELMKAYREENLEKLYELIRQSESGIASYETILLTNRNRNWVARLNKIMPERAVTVAVGAGHLPGDNGLISLLRKAGYSVTPVKSFQNRKVI